MSKNIFHNLNRMAAAAIVTIGGALAGSAAQAQTTVGAGYWHTSGNKIVDANGSQVRIAGINWYGFETSDYLVHGLWAQDYKTVLNTVKAQGYNVVRIPFSNQMVESNPVPTNYTQSVNGTAANQALVGATALQDLDTIVAYAGSIGLRVILDNHRSEAGNSNESNGLWYTSAYPQSNWIADWKTMATRYSDSRFTFDGNPTVIGVDLRNEPHSNGSNGACWTGDTAMSACPVSQTSQNWPVAATGAGNAVLAINPNLLVFVEGVDCYNGTCGWQGGNLMGVANNPIKLNVANRLVYSAHDYGPAVYQQPWFNGGTTAASLNQTWNNFWGYISANGTAPVWLGEFGTTNNSADISSTVAGSEGQWFSTLVAYLKNNSSLNWTYWALNGEDSFGLLDSNYDATPPSAPKQSALAGIQFPLGGTSGSGGGSGGGSNVSLSASASSLSLNPGASATDTITVTGGASTTLSVSGLPAGVTAAFSANPTTGSSTLTFSAGSSAAAGTANVGVTGTAGSAQATTYIALTVNSQSTSSFACHVSYAVTSQWPNGFGADISIQNTGATAISGWTLTWTFANGQAITQLWNGNASQSGAHVAVTNMGYNGSLAAGSTISGIGFNGSWNGVANAVPSAFSVNGTICQ